MKYNLPKLSVPPLPDTTGRSLNYHAQDIRELSVRVSRLERGSLVLVVVVAWVFGSILSHVLDFVGAM